MNIFSLHGKWYENNENRLTSNILFFIDKFRKNLLPKFLNKFFPEIKFTQKDLEKCRINFQVYDSGKIPDAEILLGNNKRILLECKIRSNLIGKKKIKEYSQR